MSSNGDENPVRIRRMATAAPKKKRGLLRKSRPISLAIAVLLLALSIDFLTEAVRKNESVEDGAGLMTEAERGSVTEYQTTDKAHFRTVCYLPTKHSLLHSFR